MSYVADDIGVQEGSLCQIDNATDYLYRAVLGVKGRSETVPTT
jgi:hypothetical protein